MLTITVNYLTSIVKKNTSNVNDMCEGLSMTLSTTTLIIDINTAER